MALSRKLLVAFSAVTIILTATPPAMAVPLPTVEARTVSYVDNVQYRDRRWHHRPHGAYRHYRPSRHGWYGGPRGYRHHRHGYRRHSDGWWYPLAAFGAGAVIGGAIANSNLSIEANVNPRHYDWCAARYRTYRAYDNSYVPYAGARAECRSPYY